MTNLDARPDLRKYGYAPGGYMIQCAVGQHTAIDCDKRASCCLVCAEAALAKEEQASRKPFSGAKLFELKATHGLPLDVAVDRIVNSEKLSIDWCGFIDQARVQGWYDFQTLDVAEQALTDADVPRDYRDLVILRMKCYILETASAQRTVASRA